MAERPEMAEEGSVPLRRVLRHVGKRRATMLGRHIRSIGGRVCVGGTAIGTPGNPPAVGHRSGSLCTADRGAKSRGRHSPLKNPDRLMETARRKDAAGTAGMPRTQAAACWRNAARTSAASSISSSVRFTRASISSHSCSVRHSAGAKPSVLSPNARKITPLR
jgi:hypothetical protein